MELVEYNPDNSIFRCFDQRTEQHTKSGSHCFWNEIPLKICKVFFSLTDEVVTETKKFEKAGIKSIDALHLAVATINEIDYLFTCDDAF